ncbi:MAG: hypothetical protein WKG00_31440 [Polyangiaceae bacterium]
MRERADAVARARATRSSEPPARARWSDPHGGLDRSEVSGRGLAAAAGPAPVIGDEGHTLARGAFVRGIEEDETTRRSERNPSAPDLVHGARLAGDATRVARAVSGRSSVVTLVFAAALTLGTALAAMFWTRDAGTDARPREARAPLAAGVEVSLIGATRAVALAALAPRSSDAVSVEGRTADELPAVPVEAVPSLPPAPPRRRQATAARKPPARAGRARAA